MGMEGVYPTDFLDNIQKYERRVHCGMYWSPHGLSIVEGKRGVMDIVFKINCASALFGKSVDKSRISKDVEEGLLPYIEEVSGEIGYWIHYLRLKNVPDERIYSTLVGVRDYYLEKNNLCESDFAFRKMSARLYDVVKDSLVSLGK